jgi:hypothetical protein
MAMTSNHDGPAAAADTSFDRPSKTVPCTLPAAVLQTIYRKEGVRSTGSQRRPWGKRKLKRDQ